MRITQEADYALRVIAFLTEEGYGQIIEAKKIAEKQAIPLRFALKLLRKLQQAGLIRSYRGINGGYALNRIPQQISLKDVIEAIEGPIYVNNCLCDIAYCNLVTEGTHCQVHLALAKIQESLLNDLEKVNFEDLQKKK
ncbi:Rrf2 family transcriptional regulator [Heliorestis acidaminivorans]|uniref:Rrf2 family transcriptional regulator n=1 Tax=Heliorestis acidaminivorans TaxID=553427 RepID=A0A6I0F8M5_9FIRM|nr:Rrf2 family transcriptional regulator [Heliorestis acidaminivorans]KAB2953838.1 Rrf2 family transcriptional regulator [Heliorestis acidaminivorans]